MRVEVIALAKGTLKSRLRLTWKTEPSWLARKVLRTSSIELSAEFAGTADIWHVLPEWRRVPPVLDRELQRLEHWLLRGEELSGSALQGKTVHFRPSASASFGQSDGDHLSRPTSNATTYKPQAIGLKPR